MNRTTTTLPVALILLMALTGIAGADTMLPGLSTRVGETVEYNMAIHNDTGAAHSYSLTVSAPAPGLAGTFLVDGRVTDTAQVDSGVTIAVIYRLPVPADFTPGDYTFTVTATAADGAALVQPLMLAVSDAYGIRIVGQVANFQAFTGQPAQVSISAANMGSEKLSNVHLVVDAPASWSVEVTPAHLPSLAPNESVTFDISILVPKTETPGHQMLQLSVGADQVTGPTTNIDVRVQKSPHAMVGAAAVAIAAAIAALIYFRRRGRR